MKRKPPVVDPTDMDHPHRRAGAELLRLQRGEALQLACSLCKDAATAWVSRAYRGGRLDAKCLGRFALVNPERPDLPWPAVVFLVASRTLGAELGQQAMLSLYLSPEGSWVCAVEPPTTLPDGTRRVVVAWEQYAGDAAGPPGVVNGDDASGTAPVSPATPSRPELTDDEPVDPPARVARRSGRNRPGTASDRKPPRRPRPPAAGLPASPPPPPAAQQRLELVLRLLRLLGE